MDEHHRKVLDLLAQGKISVAEAEKLLEKLKAAPAAEREAVDEKDEEAEVQDAPKEKAKDGKKKRPRFLRVQVDSDEDEKINVRVPMNWVRMGVNLGALIPKHARRALEKRGVDLSEMNSLKEVEDMLDDLGLDIDDQDGNKVRIFWE